MATLTAIVHNALWTIHQVQPRVETRIDEFTERNPEVMPPRMRWVLETDFRGRNILRARWVEDGVTTKLQEQHIR